MVSVRHEREPKIGMGGSRKKPGPKSLSKKGYALRLTTLRGFNSLRNASYSPNSRSARLFGPVAIQGKIR